MSNPCAHTPKSQPPKRQPSSIWPVISWFLQGTLSLLFMGIFFTSLSNVLGAGFEVEAMAKEMACRNRPLPCSSQYTSELRTPFAHTFQMHTSSGECIVRCQRQYIFVGDWSCTSSGETAQQQPTQRPSARPLASSKPVPAPIASPRAKTVPASSAAPTAPSATAP